MNQRERRDWKFIGLLTHQHKQAGYFISQDEDFIYLWHRRNGNPECISIFLYEVATIKEVRDTAQKHFEETLLKALDSV